MQPSICALKINQVITCENTQIKTYYASYTIKVVLN